MSMIRNGYASNALTKPSQKTASRQSRQMPLFCKNHTVSNELAGRQCKTASQQSNAETQANAKESQMPPMDTKQAAERVYTAIKYNDGKEFWLKEEFGELNEAFYPYLQGLTNDMITHALTTLQTQGNIYLQKPNVWKAVHDRDL